MVAAMATERLEAIWDDKRRCYTLQHRGYEISIPAPIFSAEEIGHLFNEFVKRVNAKLGDHN